MQLDVAVVSVIISGCIAVIGIVVPILSSAISESRRWAREQRAHELERFHKTSRELIDQLGIIRSGWVHEATGGSWHQTYAKCIAAYYAFEQVVWPRCEPAEKNRLEKLRTAIEKADSQALYDAVPKLVKEIVEIGFAASEHI